MSIPTFSRLKTPEQTNQFKQLLKEMYSVNTDQLLDTAWDTFISAHPEKYFWLAEVDDIVVGIAVCHPWEVLPKPGKLVRSYWQLSNFYIQPEFRNNGLGTSFLQYIINQATEQKVEKILVLSGNTEFFGSQGFKQVEHMLVKKIYNQ